MTDIELIRAAAERVMGWEIPVGREYVGMMRSSSAPEAEALRELVAAAKRVLEKHWRDCAGSDNPSHCLYCALREAIRKVEEIC